jgi:hypothetical protein
MPPRRIDIPVGSRKLSGIIYVFQMQILMICKQSRRVICHPPYSFQALGLSGNYTTISFPESYLTYI